MAAPGLLSKAPVAQRYGTFHGDAAPMRPPRAASWFSRLVFGYAAPMLATGSKRQLAMDDLWELDQELHTRVAFDHFQASYAYYDQSLNKAVAASFGPKLLVCGLGSLVCVACALFAPVVLDRVVTAFSTPAIDVQNLARWVAAFFASRLVNAFTEAHANFAMEIVLLRLTASLKALLFAKAMRRSVQSRHDNAMADVSNLFTVDLDNVLWAGYQLSIVWVTPLQVSAVVYMLYSVLDVAAFAGLAVIFLTVLANYFIAKGYMDAYEGIMRFKDARMKVIKEVFGAIQVIKLNAWESKFLERIRRWRAKETEAIARYLNLIAVMTCLLWGTPLGVSVVSFGMYSLVLGKQLTAAKVFSSMVLFAAIREPLARFPDGLQQLLQARLSLGRMAEYLASYEVDPEQVARVRPSGHGDDVVVKIEDGVFQWNADSDGQAQAVLSEVSFAIRQGEFAVVYGAVGSGKSSLCAALLGEIPKLHGSVFVGSTRVAYCSQQPWIQNMTIRDNILFGQPLDKTKYDRVLDACGLVKDIAAFPAGDQTEIGQKGVNLSGGQKARISLARACYADADLYVLDSPLAAVDAVVQTEIFKKCFCGLLENKTVVLVSHLQDVIQSPAVDVALELKNHRVSVRRRERTQPRRVFASLHTEAEEQDRARPGDDEPTCSGALIEEEDRAQGRVSRDVFLAYVDALGGVYVLAGFVLVLVGWQSLQSGADIWVSHWVSSLKGGETTDADERNLAVYSLLSLGAGVFVCIRAFLAAYTGIRASRYLLEKMTTSLLSAPMRFFDTNPIGHILNRYAEDTSVVDFQLSRTFDSLLTATSVNLFRVLTAVYVIKWAGLLLLPIGWVYVNNSFYFLGSSREVSRLMKVSASPILSHVAETEEGVLVLRAFGSRYVDRAIDENFRRCDASSRALYAQTVVNQWFAVRVQMVGFCVVVLIVSTLLVLHEYMSPGMAGLAFMYAVNIDTGLSWWVLAWSWTEMAMASPERVIGYTKIPAEGLSSDRCPRAIDDTWPQHGLIEFENVQFAYKPGGDLVLEGLSFTVQPSDKIGIVGRSGAGKSSLTMALFRVNELESGCIRIDGIDIASVPLKTLRSRMAIIPQVPVLFKGAIRGYMDPFDEYSDDEIWSALEKAGLKAMVSALQGKLLHELSENGDNFSVGERQMLCMARALLRKSSIVVMDEATASIDRETETTLQEMIRREFAAATVLTIAHRLSTVLHSDRVLVLRDGCVNEFDSPQTLARVEGGLFRELATEGGYLSQLLD